MLQIILTRKSIWTNALSISTPISVSISVAIAGLILMWGIFGPVDITLAQEAVQVGVNNYAVEPDGSIDVSIDLASDTVSVAALNAGVSYDPMVVTQTSCTMADFMGVCNESVPGQVLITGVNVDGANGNSQIATISFKSIGVPSSSTPLQVEVSTLANVTGEALAYSVSDGAILIRQTASRQNDGARNQVYLPMVGRNSFKNADGNVVNLTPVDVVMNWVCAFLGNFGWTSDACY